MLKLMKHEFRATGRIMIPLCLLTLVAAVGGNLATRQLLEADNDLLNVLGVLLMGAFAVAIAAVCIMSVVVMVQRFYKNLLQDEGYVMLTLPVSVHQHIWAKMLVSTVWFAATAATVALAFFVLVYELGTVEDIFYVFSIIFRDLLELDAWTMFNGAVFGAELVVLLLLAAFSACLEFYSALAIGHSFSNHKMLLSIVFFFAINAAFSVVGSGFMMAVNVTPFPEMVSGLLAHSGGAMRMTHLMLGGITVLALVQGVVYYFLTYIPLTRRLNLE